MRSSAFLAALETLDIEAMRKLSAAKDPHLPQPQSDRDALIALHMARTQCEALAFRHRAYSHSWLMERRLPSQLPDRLRASADQICPRAVSAVGVSINFGPPELRPAKDYVQDAICDVIENCYADGREDPAYVKPRMDEAGKLARRRIFGAVGLHALGSIQA